MKKMFAKILCVTMLITNICSIGLYTSASAEAETTNVVTSAVALIITNRTTLANSAGSPSNAGKMGNGSETLSIYQVHNMSHDANNAKEMRRLFLRFDLSEILAQGIVSGVNLKIHLKADGKNASSTMKVYAADALSFTDAASFVSNYANWSSVQGSIGADTIASFNKAAGSNLTATTKTLDISDYISDRIDAGYATATVMLDYVPSEYNSAYTSYIAAETTAYAPILEVTYTPFETTEENIASSAVAHIVTNYSTNVNSAESTEYAGKMGDGSTSMDTYPLINMSHLAGNAQNIKRLFLKFDLSSILAQGAITEAKLNINFKATGDAEATLKVYAADGLNFTNSASFVSNYANWSSVQGSIGAAAIASYNKAYKGDTTGSTKTLDISEYINSRAALGYRTATVMIDYVQTAYVSTYKSCIAAATTAYAPKLTVKYTQTKSPVDISSSVYAPFTQNISTGVNSAGSTQSVGNMGNGSTTLSTIPLKNNAYKSNTTYGKAAVKFDITDLFGAELASAKLKLNMKFQSSNAGTLYIYGIDNAGAYTSSATFVSAYPNWSDLSPKVSQAATYARAYGFATTAQNIEIDIKDYVVKAIENGWSSLDLMFEYKSSDTSSSSRNAYIAIAGGYEPKIEVSTFDIKPLFTSNGTKITNLMNAVDSVTASFVSYQGGVVPTTAYPIIAFYNNRDDLIGCNIGEMVNLDGTGKVLTVSKDITDLDQEIDTNCYAKMFVWKDLVNIAPLKNYRMLGAE